MKSKKKKKGLWKTLKIQKIREKKSESRNWKKKGSKLEKKNHNVEIEKKNSWKYIIKNWKIHKNTN